ncbi:MAG TPA: extracellular solute-binding protein [Tepidimicrobium sp.]|nr:extracellular solute-binding protein [Tepidimicrobium sp.]
MRRIVSLIIIIFILIWSYNLFVDDIIDLNKPEEKPYKGVINMLDLSTGGGRGHNYRIWLQDRIASFERNNPGIYIELTFKDDRVEIEEGMEDIPDIVSVDLDFPDFNILESLDDYFEKDEWEGFKHQVLKPLTYDKELKAIPVAMSTYALYINLEKFNERGVMPPLNGEWTYEEFVDSLERLTYTSQEDGVYEYGFMAPMGLGDYNIWGIMLSDGAELINPRRLRYNFYGEKAIKGLERVIDLKNSYNVVPAVFGVADGDTAWDMFHREQNIAAYIGGSWAVKALDRLYRDGDGFNFDVVNFPIGNKGLPVVLSDGIVSYGVIGSLDPKKTGACVKLLKYLTEDSNQRALEEVGLFTVKREISDMYSDNIKMKRIEKSLAYTEYIPFIDNWKEIKAIIHDELNRAVLGEKLSYEAIEDAKNRIDEIDEK